jgi:phosphatidylglycerophosphate synthase
MTGLWATGLLLAVLAGTTGLGGVGAAVGVAYGLALTGLVWWGLGRLGATFGPADWVTLARAVLTGGVTALVADAAAGATAPVGVLVGLMAAALALDWVDGQVARRTGTASTFGWWFDMEVDSFLLFVLSVYAAGTYGPWVLLIGGMRYVFGAAGWALPWMRATLPPRYWRKVVAAVQGVALVVAAAGVLPEPVTRVALLLAAGLLLESFGRDVLWLWRRRNAVRTEPSYRGPIRNDVSPTTRSAAS